MIRPFPDDSEILLRPDSVTPGGARVLTPGTRLGHTKSSLPSVWAAWRGLPRETDTKLKRQVALKVLPGTLTADRDRLARFQREAEVLASLNHLNIAAIYGLEDSTDTKALVMEVGPH